MGEALLLVDGDDPGAVLLAGAFRRHGWRPRLLDLRFHRPTLDGTEEPPTVWLEGVPVWPDVVVNRTGTSRLGLAAAPALARQLATTWSGRHLAAREEQGLLLACFDLWERTSRLYNPVRTLDRRLLRPAVEAELRAADVPVGPAGDTGREGVCWIVDGTIVAAATRPGPDQRWSVTPLSDGTAEVVRRAAGTMDLRLGQLDLWQPREEPAATRITGWRPIPLFRSFWEHTGVDVAALVVAQLVGEPPAATPPFLAADLETNLLTAGTRPLTRK